MRLYEPRVCCFRVQSPSPCILFRTSCTKHPKMQKTDPNSKRPGQHAECLRKHRLDLRLKPCVCTSHAFAVFGFRVQVHAFCFAHRVQNILKCKNQTKTANKQTSMPNAYESTDLIFASNHACVASECNVLRDNSPFSSPPREALSRFTSHRSKHSILS